MSKERLATTSGLPLLKCCSAQHRRIGMPTIRDVVLKKQPWKTTLVDGSCLSIARPGINNAYPYPVYGVFSRSQDQYATTIVRSSQVFAMAWLHGEPSLTGTTVQRVGMTCRPKPKPGTFEPRGRLTRVWLMTRRSSTPRS